MPDAAYFGIAAGFLNLVAFVPYILSIFGRRFRWGTSIIERTTRTAPNRESWLNWAFVGAVVLPAYSLSGAQETAWVAAALVVGPCVVAVLSLKYGEDGWSAFDQACLAGAFMSMLMWALTGSSVVGLLFALAADACGVAATMRHAYRQPRKENGTAWVLFLLGDAINLLAVPDWSWASAPVWIYALYMIGHTGPIVLIIWLRRKGV